MSSVAVLSMHTSPLVQPGHGDSGGMNVYVRELSASLAQAGVDVRVYVRRWAEGLPDRVRVEPGLEVVHVDAGPVDAGEGGPAVGRRRVRRRRRRGPARVTRRRPARQLLAVGGRRPPPQARAGPAAGRHLPHARPGQGRCRRPGTRAARACRGRGHRLLRRDLARRARSRPSSSSTSTAPDRIASSSCPRVSTMRSSRPATARVLARRSASTTGPRCCSWDASSR